MSCDITRMVNQRKMTDRGRYSDRERVLDALVTAGDKRFARRAERQRKYAVISAKLGLAS